MITDELLKKDAFKNIIGQDKIKHQLKSTILAKRNAIIMGPPGVGKTTLAKELASLTKDKIFVRIQGSPDLTVEDILGDIDPIKALKFGPTSKEAFTPGKIFKADKGILFFDELNRCPEKLQNTLLQVLQEKKVTLGTYDIDFNLDFIFIATMNPEDTNTEKLSDVLLDRFDILYMNYPENLEEETKIVTSYGQKITKISNQLVNIMTAFVRWLRDLDDIEKKPSVRASIGLYERAQANAKINAREEATLEDFNEIADSVLSHRIGLKPSAKYLKSENEVINDELKKFMQSNIAKELKQAGDLP